VTGREKKRPRGGAPVIRSAAEADLPLLCALLEQLAADDASVSTKASQALPPALPAAPGRGMRRAFDELCARPDVQVLALEEGGRVLGMAVFMLLPSLAGGGRPRALIDEVVVDRAFRGRGHGERLVRHCIALARARGVRKLQLTSNLRRAAAHRFYERLGFQATHRGYSMLFE
jgi:GNAT superfamily N-acetyltransferase